MNDQQIVDETLSMTSGKFRSKHCRQTRRDKPNICPEAIIGNREYPRFKGDFNLEIIYEIMFFSFHHEQNARQVSQLVVTTCFNIISKMFCASHVIIIYKCILSSTSSGFSFDNSMSQNPAPHS